MEWIINKDVLKIQGVPKTHIQISTSFKKEITVKKR